MDCPDTSFTRFSGRTWRLKAAVHQLRFDHWSCRTFSHAKVIFSLSVGGNPLPLRFVLAPVVMVFSKLSPRPNWNVSC